MSALMLIISVLGFEGVSHACDPADIEPTNTTPADQALDVPIDSIIIGELSNGLGGWEGFMLKVTTDGVSVSGENGGFCADTVGWDSLCYVTFLPSEELTPQSTYLIEVQQMWDDGNETRLSASFTTGEALTEAITDTPALNINQVNYNPYDDLCDIEAEYRFEMNVVDAPNDPHELNFLYLYESDSEGTPQVLRNVVPIVDAAMDVHADLPETSDGSGCFVAIAVDGAGRQNTTSAAVCQDDTPSGGGNGEGGAVGGCSCSTTTQPMMAWSALLLAALAGFRRRKTPSALKA